ncbi:YceI family protein [Bacteriovorax sp. Seq25_V]|uniref:YceI family protein n=1 Tax=Bacteriovorax sp. Seq25_V TaxID=1201288 RepID=UPI00038A0D73|nr:YceI family protein [Bacteriovorax sp. Seq25_V]EQC46564.1 YceI-like domain protein [Bacteriovorax sp. Seq25_V]
MKFLISLLLILSNVCAKEVAIDYESYKDALNGANKIVFDMESTKAGFITTGFSGVVKSFKLNYEIDQENIKDAKVYFFVANLDTDIDARNEKMLNLCLEAEKYPVIMVELGNLEIGKSEKDSEIQIRGQKYPLKVNVEVGKIDDVFKVKFNSKISLKGFNIPDPSIFIASVRDLIEIHGEVEIK